MQVSELCEGLLSGKRGLIMGIATSRSIAMGIARATHSAGAELAFTAQNERLGVKVGGLVESLGSLPVLLCDVGEEGGIGEMYASLDAHWPEGLDFVVHSLAAADPQDLEGPYYRVSEAGFRRALEISCYSLTELARLSLPRFRDGGSILTLTYLGAERAVPGYNVMGVAKAALEASVRYLAADLGPHGVRVNAISAGPVRSVSGAGISTGRYIYAHSAASAPLRHNPSPESIGGSALYLLSSLSSAVTGEVHHVDGGFHSVAFSEANDHKEE
ncbi:MAG: enoyl-ACP reductase [Alphaproteobacteria bacterium]